MATPLNPDGAAAAASHEKRWVAMTSVVAAVGLTGMKLVVGLMTGSLGILSEAAHSGLDLVAAVVTFFAVRASDKPADAEHRYGHGKIENLSALFETFLLLITCVWIIVEAVRRLFFHEVHVDVTFWSFAVVLTSIGIDVSRSRALMRVAKKHNSQALEADALHFGTDVWSSCVVLLGLGLVALGEFTGQKALFGRADALAALGVAVIVILVSYRLGRRTVDALLDRTPTGVAPKVEAAARNVPDVLGVQRVRMRESGNQTFVDLVIEVERNLPLERSSRIGQAVEEGVRAVVPGADVTIQLIPVRSDAEKNQQRVRAIAADLGVSVHSLLAYEEGGRPFLDLHMEVDEEMPIERAHDLASRLEERVQKELPHLAGITTHIEAWRPEAPIHSVLDNSEPVAAIVRGLVAETPGIVECHDVALRRVGAGLFLTMHCSFEPELTVHQVHDISSAFEERLRAAIPGLIRVTTHPEPIPHHEG